MAAGPLLTIDQYHAMIEAGVLTTDDPVELIEGLLVVKARQTPAHCGSTGALSDLFKAVIADGTFYHSHPAITLADGEPEPDGAVVRGTVNDYWKRHPNAADVLLVIEVADATLARDRGIKLRSYARAGIPVYWIVNLVDRRVEVYTDPDPAGTPHPTYRTNAVYAAGGAAPLSVGGVELPSVAVAAILPPA